MIRPLPGETNGLDEQRLVCDGGKDPLAPIREHEEVVEKLADQDRDDLLDALARCLMAAARGEQPDPEDCKEGGLPLPRDSS